MSELTDQLNHILVSGGQAYVRNLAGAERSVERGQFNMAKVLRAAAHTQRTLALQAARQLVDKLSGAELLALIATELEGISAFEGYNETARSALADIIARSRESLEQNPDVLETAVPIIIMGCYNCGTITEEFPLEICPQCGALAIELEWFGPFYAETKEHLGQLSPEAVIDTLAAIPQQVADVILEVDDLMLIQKPSEDEWCAKEIVAHMFETDKAFQERVKTILASDGVPSLPRTKPPWKLHEGKGYEEYTAQQLLDMLTEIRNESLALIRPLSSQQWVQSGTLMGSVTSILDLGTWVANHDKGHLEQIKRLVLGE